MSPPTANQPNSSFVFLSLAPATSDSYPRTQASRTAGTGEAAPVQRRSSSVSSGQRVLKLGPVHWGEHPDEHKEDFHDVAPSMP